MRFDIYKLPKGGAGYLIDVQSDFLSHLPTRTVIPLAPHQTHTAPIKDLNPTLTIDSKIFVLMTHEIASILKKQLGRAVANLSMHQDHINRALDLLFTGF